MTHPYEDPRRSTAERVEDLIARMTIEEKAGLLFHPRLAAGPAAEQLIKRQLISHYNVLEITDARAWARWHNRLQELAADTRLGVPVTLSTDPRHAFSANPNASLGAGLFSQWPEPIGLAAIGDPATVERFADTARREYLALGIRVALHPQADLATEPRWARISGTFGEDAALAARLVAAYVRGFQGNGLGGASVATMVKHFPGGGPQLDGEDPHFEYGKEQVYPGGNFEYHLRPFAAALQAGAAQIMPYYGVPVGTEYETVGFCFNRDVIGGLLRERLGFDGVVCTDWGVVSDTEWEGETFAARAWGAERLTREERLLKILDAGADQFGGESCPELIVNLVRAGRLDERRVDVSARRILRDKFALGLFDDRYVDPEAAAAIVGCAAFAAAGLAAQRAALTLLKNDPPPGRERPLLPLPEGAAVFVSGLDERVAGQYFRVAPSAASADCAIVRLPAPYDRRPGAVERFFHAGTLELDAETRGALTALPGQLPTVVVANLERPVILTPIAATATALVGEFGASDGAVLDVLTGRDEPRGTLPFDLPSSMAEVLAQRPDVPFDTPRPLFRFGHGLAYQRALSIQREEATVKFDVAVPDLPVPAGPGSPVPPAEELLALDRVSAGYGASMVLHDVTVAVPKGTMVALLGANGAGKTTLLRVASGLLRPSAGEVRLGGAAVTGQPAHRRARGGLCLIPEGRGIFPSLTVRENLEIESPPWVKGAALGRALELFPALGSRMRQVAGTMSGGEQQMLALARAVLAEPKVILVDEISMGLAPRLVDSLFEALTELAATGVSMLIVEQYVQRALEICSLTYIINKGTVVYSGPSQSLQRDTVIRKYLGT